MLRHVISNNWSRPIDRSNRSSIPSSSRRSSNLDFLLRLSNFCWR